MNEISVDLSEEKIELIIDGLKSLRKNALDYHRWDVVGDLKVEFENYLVDLNKQHKKYDKGQDEMYE